MATQNDVVFDDLIIEKYYLEDQELSLEELYLAMEISLGEQASNDLVKAKLNEETSIFNKRIDLRD